MACCRQAVGARQARPGAQRQALPRACRTGSLVTRNSSLADHRPVIDPLSLTWRVADRPSVPGKPVLVPNDKHSPEPDVVTIRWEPPLYDGGSPIKGYLVEHRRTGSPHWVRSSPALVRLTELTLSGLEPGWRYQFRVSAQNAAGLSEPGELSDLLTVTLQRTAASAPFFVKELKDTVALENEKAEMSVQVRGTPTPSLSWFKDGVEIFSSRSYRVLTDSETSTLIIHQAALSDEGEIKCSATNRVGYAVTRAKLVLEASPSIRLPRQYEEGLLFEQGEVIRLKVSVAGRPTPEVTWQLNGEPVPGSGRWEAAHSERYATLRVGEARRTDRGEYQVRAANRIGEDVASFLVTVADKPMPPGRAKVVMTLGRSVTLSWAAPEDDGGCKIGNYIVEYYRLGWNMWLKAATCRQLTTTLGDLIEGSQYKFRVKAENPYGVSEPSTESDVVFIPDPKRGLLEPPDSRPDESADAMDVWLEDKKRAMSPSPTIGEQYGERKTKKKRGPMAPPQPSSTRSDSMSPTPTPEDLKQPVIPRRRGKAERVDIRQDVQEVQEEIALEKKLEERRRIQEQMRFDEREKKIKEPIDEKDTERKHEEKRRVKELLKFEEIKKAEEERKAEEEERNKAQDKKKDEELRKIAEKKRREDLRLSTPQSPRVQHDRFHGSSELMLVLLPHSRGATEERETSKRELFESSLALEGDAVAPPLSLSAPELGSGDPPEQPLIRAAYSSTELLHDRAMARFYQDMAQEEAQSTIRRHSSLQRRRSFGSRARDMPEVGSLQGLVSSVKSLTERLEVSKTTPVVENKLNYSTRSRLEKKKSFSRESSMDSILDDSMRKSLITQTSEEDMEYEDSSFDEHEEESEYEEEESIQEEEMEEEEEEEVSTEEKTGSMIVYTSESEEETRSYIMEEETTYRPKLVNMKYNEDSMISAYERRGPLILGAATKVTASPEVAEHKQVENVTPPQGNDIKLKPILKRQTLDLNSTKTSDQTVREPLTPNVEELKPKTPASLEKKFEPNFSAAMPKPILKVRDHSMERQSPVPQRGAPMAFVEPELNLLSSSRSNIDEGSDYETGMKKKVRIEEPGEVAAREELEKKENIAVPRERRESITPPKEGGRRLSPIEELDASKVLISHYSEIVAEYGKGRKPPRKLYANLEALKAAAAQEEAEAPDIPEITVNEPEPDPEPEQEPQQPEPEPEPHHEPAISVVIEEPVHFEPQRISPRTVHFEPEVEEPSRMLEPPLQKPKKRSGGKRSPSPRKRKPSVTLENVEARSRPGKTEMARKTSPPLPLRLHTTAEKKVHSYLDFLMDFSLFILACWLYLFKDERLSIPVLFLMIYRQAHEAFQRKLEALRNKLPRRLLFWRRSE